MNTTNLIGRITKDLDLRKTTNGNSVVNFTLAVNRQFKKDGEQDADFIQIQVWNKTADNLYKYCGKGSLIGLCGRIQTRNFDGKDGKRVYVTEVVAESVQFLDTKNSQSQSQSEPQSDYGSSETVEIDSDNLPF